MTHYTYEDKHIWHSRILTATARQLSEIIIPSFNALTGDGMTQSQVDQYLPHVERRCQEVLQELERARQTIKGRIHNEYARMRHGESVVGDALAQAREMLEEIIDLTPLDIQRQIYPLVQEVM
jgi:cell division septum initiation protein DivIVA